MLLKCERRVFVGLRKALFLEPLLLILERLSAEEEGDDDGERDGELEGERVFRLEPSSTMLYLGGNEGGARPRARDVCVK